MDGSFSFCDQCLCCSLLTENHQTNESALPMVEKKLKQTNPAQQEDRTEDSSCQHVYTAFVVNNTLLYGWQHLDHLLH
jgi:hypothetical protein